MNQTTAVILARRPDRTFVADDLSLGTIELPELAAGQSLVFSMNDALRAVRRRVSRSKYLLSIRSPSVGSVGMER